MARRPFLKTFWAVLKTLILGSAVASNAAAKTVVPVTVPPSPDRWAAVREQYQDRIASNDLPRETRKTLETAVRDNTHLAQTIRLSYQALPQGLHGALDRFWLELPEIQQNPALFEVMLRTRQQVSVGDALYRGDILMQQWLHRAHHKPGHYDQGGGND